MQMIARHADLEEEDAGLSGHMTASEAKGASGCLKTCKLDMAGHDFCSGPFKLVSRTRS